MFLKWEKKKERKEKNGGRIFDLEISCRRKVRFFGWESEKNYLVEYVHEFAGNSNKNDYPR